MSKFKKKAKKKNNQSGSKFEAKFLKHYDEREADLLRSYEPDDLRRIVAECNANVMRSVNEVQENPEYIAAKEVVSTFNAALKEVRDYQDSKRNFVIQILHERGIVDAGLSEDPLLSDQSAEQEVLEVLQELDRNRHGSN
jgi:uncharacterized SAM-dependent methyltransferase